MNVNIIGRISVIVPVYNVEKYLFRCISSIIHQTYTDLEIILVDDGSADASGKMCDSFFSDDPRIKIIRTHNNGLVNARKSGLQLSGSDYIMWVDADDWIEPDYVERMAMAAYESQADMVASDLYFEIGDEQKTVRNHFEKGVYTSAQLLPSVLYAGEFFEYGIQPHLVTKLIKRELLASVMPFVEGIIVAGEDAAVTYPCALKARCICITDICSYHYVQHPGAMTKTYLENENMRILTLVRHILKFCKDSCVADLLKPQLNQYMKYLLLLRNIRAFDHSQDELLSACGTLPVGCRIVIYGAGGMGQQIFWYLHKHKSCSLALWVDQNYMYYQKAGLPVSSSEALKDNPDMYDYIIIANINSKTVQAIIRYLKEQMVPEEKIRWFSERISDQNVLCSKIVKECPDWDSLRP